MSHKTYFNVKKPVPVSVGTGYVALDVVINGKNDAEPHIWAGGSCGNVLTILAYIGWESMPIARLGKDVAADRIFEDLEQWGVKTNFIYTEKTVDTPIVIERIQSAFDGIPKHKFEWKCPNCRSKLPRYRPILVKSTPQIITDMPTSQVFYFDRISRSIIDIAIEQRSRGALIIFEPYKIKESEIFQECINVAHIVKYSYEQISNSSITKMSNIPLEIQTLGGEGLRYRYQPSKKKQNKWKAMQAFHVSKLIDTAGAGDWCTAGLIHLIGQNGSESFLNSKKIDIENALKFGQSMAALNCKYEGARGLMYNINKKQVFSMINKIMDEGKLEGSFPNLADRNKKIFQSLCPSCSKIKHTSN